MSLLKHFWKGRGHEYLEHQSWWLGQSLIDKARESLDLDIIPPHSANNSPPNTTLFATSQHTLNPGPHTLTPPSTNLHHQETEKPMFGLILPSRPCLTLTPLTPTTYTLAIAPTPPFTHLVVFLLPGQLLPLNTAAAVYIRFPPSTNSAAANSPANEFRFLGAIGNEKPSAIFRVRGYDAGKGGDAGFDGGGMGGGGGEDEMVDEGEAPTTAAAGAVNGTGGGIAGGEEGGAGEIQLGVAIEPLPQILASLAALQSQSSSAATAQPSRALTKVSAQSAPVSTKILAQRIIRNAFNFLASFAGTQSGAEVVPLKAFQDWWVKFERRVENDPGFLEREEEDG